MANQDNQCAQLEIIDKYPESQDPLREIFEHQKMMQETTYAYDFSDMNLRDLMDFWHMNNHALTDEKLETLDALGGINDGMGAGFWRYGSPEGDINGIANLSENDLLELKFEIVDQLHFLANKWAATGISYDEMSEFLGSLEDIVKTQTDAIELEYSQSMSLSQIRQCWLTNFAKSMDQQNQTTNLLGGPIGSAIWKRWKKDYGQATKMSIKNFNTIQMDSLLESIAQEVELMFEQWASIGGTAAEIYNLYFSKAEENKNRQKRGY